MKERCWECGRWYPYQGGGRMVEVPPDGPEMMLLQVNGKTVKRIPKVIKIVEIPGKLVNILTEGEERSERNE